MTATLIERSSGSLADQAYHQLRDQLVLLDIPPGAPIIEGRLSAQLGIGRTPIREGLKKLESDRLVVSYPRRGTFATQVDITDLADISELRQVLEPLAARRSASRARPEVRAALASTADRIASMGPEPADRRPLMEYDLTVHRMIYQAAENPYIEETLVRLDNLATRIWCLTLDRLPSVSEHIHEHVDLLRAIVDQDEDRAARLAAEHVRHFESTIRAVL